MTNLFPTTKKPTSFFRPNRRQFIFGVLIPGTIGLVSCTDDKPVRVTTVTTTPSPSPSPSATASAIPMPILPPLEAKTYPANLKNAILATDEMVNHFAKVLDSPATLIHAVRALGKNFKRADGSNAVDFLCSRYSEEVTVNGQKYVHFLRTNGEFHENSFLKTFIEAGVSPDQPVLVNGNKYSLRQVGNHAKSLLRIDPNNLKKYAANYTQEHLPWGLIAFSNMMPGGNGMWVNAYGETIVLQDVIDKALEEYDSMCQSLRPAMEKHEEISEAFHMAISDYSCFGGHSVYAFLSCLKNGYTDRNLKSRILNMLDLSIYRLAKQSETIEKVYGSVAKGPISPNPQEEAMLTKKMEQVGVTKDEVVEMVTLRAIIKLTGHLLEAVNFAKLHKLFQPSADQQKYIQAGEQKLFASIVKMRALKLEALKNFDPKQFGDVIIGLGHASRAMKLLSPDNPDKNAKAI